MNYPNEKTEKVERAVDGSVLTLQNRNPETSPKVGEIRKKDLSTK